MTEAGKLAAAMNALRFIATFSPGPQLDSYHRLLALAGSFAAMQTAARETIASINEDSGDKNHLRDISNVIQYYQRPGERDDWFC